MEKEEFNEKYKEFQKHYKGFYLPQLNFLNTVEKGNLEIIVEFNKPQDQINNMNLKKEYEGIPIIYKSNLNREIKTINLQNYKSKINKKRRDNIMKSIRDYTKSW